MPVTDLPGQDVDEFGAGVLETGKDLAFVGERHEERLEHLAGDKQPFSRRADLARIIVGGLGCELGRDSKGVPIVIGYDNTGRNPAALIAQKTLDGQWRVQSRAVTATERTTEYAFTLAPQLAEISLSPANL